MLMLPIWLASLAIAFCWVGAVFGPVAMVYYSFQALWSDEGEKHSYILGALWSVTIVLASLVAMDYLLSVNYWQ